MMKSVTVSAVLLWVAFVSHEVLLAANAQRDANGADTMLEVLGVSPSRFIKHKVELKSRFDREAVTSRLLGPRYFSHEIGVQSLAANDSKACLTWYEIEEPPQEPERVLHVRDALNGDKVRPVTVSTCKFLLSAAQWLTTGTPRPIPESLNYFKAYQVVDAPNLEKKIRWQGSLGPTERVALRAVYVCVPAEQWHHDEHVSIKMPEVCFVVYQLESHEHEAVISTMDQFGLNELKVQSSEWMCARATVLQQNDGQAVDKD